jgi:hypothetical protein
MQSRRKPLSCLACVCLLAILSVPNLIAQQSEAPNWQDWSFLLGEWTGTGSGQPGQGTGKFAFKPDLQRRVLVRTNYAEYPATKEKPAFRHDDLMIIYRESSAGPAKAIYFDSEGHVIRYVVQINESAKTATFLSEPTSGAPSYRLTYIGKGPDEVRIRFEVAPPNKPDQFQTYIEASAQRTGK